jgi:plasmid stabilization system protein ParE
MTFEVIWKTAALDHLADIYVSLSVEERARISNGVEALNTSLAEHPSEIGEARSNGIRIAFTSL